MINVNVKVLCSNLHIQLGWWRSRNGMQQMFAFDRPINANMALVAVRYCNNAIHASCYY